MVRKDGSRISGALEIGSCHSPLLNGEKKLIMQDVEESDFFNNLCLFVCFTSLIIKEKVNVQMTRTFTRKNGWINTQSMVEKE